MNLLTESIKPLKLVLCFRRGVDVAKWVTPTLGFFAQSFLLFSDHLIDLALYALDKKL